MRECEVALLTLTALRRRVEGGANSVLRLFKEFRYNSGSADNRITLDEFKTCLKGMAIMVRNPNPQPAGLTPFRL